MKWRVFKSDRKDKGIVPHSTLFLFFALLIFSGSLISCGSGSQVPLSIRERPDEAELQDDFDFEETPEQAELDEEVRRRMEEREREREELERDFRVRTNMALNQYVKAQTAFYAGEFETALRHIDFALLQHETADLYALRGAVEYARGRLFRASEDWGRAVSMNPEVVSPLYPGMEEWYNQNF